jgi:arylsulfatase
MLAAAVLGLGVTAPLAQTSALSRAVAVSDHQQPAIPHPEQNVAAAAKLAEFEKRTGKKPNIVILLIDDMGYGDPGAFGGGEAIGAATPNMDRLAAEGLKLTSTYAQQTCTPTRSAIMTGRLPVRTGLTRPILKGDKITANPWADETSVAALLSAAGYHTAAVGKWHIGESEGMRPFEVGFDEWYGYYGAEKEISQEFDQRLYPDLVLDPDKLAAYRSLGADIDLVAARKGDADDTVVSTAE